MDLQDVGDVGVVGGEVRGVAVCIWFGYWGHVGRLFLDRVGWRHEH